MEEETKSHWASAWVAWVAWGLVWLMACSPSAEVDLPAADAQRGSQAGLSWLARTAMNRFLEFHAQTGSHSGSVALFARDGRIVHARATGLANIEGGESMEMDTRFRMASMTKPVTAVAAMILVEEGRLGLDDEVAKYIPTAADLRVAVKSEVAADGRLATEALERPLTVRDLLTFRAGIGPGEGDSALDRLWEQRDIYAGSGSLATRVDRILSAPLYEQPGRVWRYGWSADVLARVVEVAAREPFDRFLESRIFTPLGMEQTTFLPSIDDRVGLASMYTQDENEDLVLVETPASDAPDWTPGGSGLVSTAGDYMRFALMLWNAGIYDGVRILSRHSVAEMTRVHVSSGVLENEGIDGLGWGLGLAVVVDAERTPMIDETGDFWWSGYYGTTFFVSPDTGLVGVVLTQNQPGPFSGLPYALYLAQTFAFWGL